MIQSLERAFRLLELLDRAGPAGLRLVDLATRAELKSPTTRNFLNSLMDLGYVRQDSANRRYFLGRHAQVLGNRERVLETLRRTAQGTVLNLQNTVRETVLLTFYDAGLRHTILAAESDMMLKAGAAPGVDEHFYSTATGRLLLALIPTAERRNLWRHLGPPEPAVWADATDLAALEKQLTELRRRGVCVYDRGDNHVVALAAAVLPRHEAVYAALGLYYPSVRDSLGRREELLDRLQEAAECIRTDYERS